MAPAAALLLLVAFTSVAWTQQTPPENSADALAIVRRALDALGGLDRVRALKIVTVRGSGSEFRSAEVQGWSPDKVSRAPHEETLVADFHGQRVSYENRTGRPDGSTRWRRFIYAGGDRAWVEFTSRMADWRPHPRAEEDRRELFRRIPHYLLLEAADNAARLRRLPDTSAAAFTCSRTGCQAGPKRCSC